MPRIEIVCGQCQQTNIRYDGPAGFLLNPRWPFDCTLCSHPLDGGPRGIAGSIRGPLMWGAVYLMHAFAGAGILMVGASLLWPDLINQPQPLRAAPVIAGLLAGLALAERSRRQGTLLGHRRRAR